jgi:hypothetical protein
MVLKTLRRLIPPLELVLALTLMGLMLLGALLYYRAVRFQRYTEPALVPRISTGCLCQSSAAKMRRGSG